MTPDLYYEAVIIIIALVLVGRTLEARARRQTSEALQQLARLQPTMATIVEHGTERVVKIDQIQPGDVLLVRPGERVAVDGIVVAGRGSLDESMLTGESMPVTRALGAQVIGGTVNRSGAIKVRATRVGPDSTLAQIVRLMRNAQASRAPILAGDWRGGGNGAGTRGRRRGAHHRVSVRDGSCGADRGDGRDRTGRCLRRADQGR